jgi:D-arabinose 1-dehydrogenase-like Zn-dependent alcohol dehydrogenase
MRVVLAVRGVPLVELIPMAQVNEAIRKVKENKARYRIVLVNDMDGV